MPTPGNQHGGGDNNSGGGNSNTGGGDGSTQTQVPTPDESAVNRADSNVRSGAGRAKDKVKDTVDSTTGTNPDGSPNPANPTYSLSTPGPARIGVPNFFINKFRIPPFLLPIYQAAGIQYGVRWEVLAAINEIETDYGRNLNVSTAGAVGWMQFLPSTWRLYGVDANGDGVKDPYNPVDAIFAAARYLRAAGADTDIRRAVFAYNHADWYVDSVLLRAQVIGGLPSNLVGSLTGLTQGRFPVQARATYAGQLKAKQQAACARATRRCSSSRPTAAPSRSSRATARRSSPSTTAASSRSATTSGSATTSSSRTSTATRTRTGICTGSPSATRCRSRSRPRSRRARPSSRTRDAAPAQPASDTTAPATKEPTRRLAAKATPKGRKNAEPAPASKERLFANPTRPNASAAGGAKQEFQRTGRIDGVETFEGYYSRILGLDRKDVQLKRLRPGARVVAGTILGRLGKVDARAPYLQFEIRPAGRGAPRVDPKPILDGWKLLESTAIYRANGKNPFFGADADNPSIGQILLMSKEALAPPRARQPADRHLRVRAPGHPRRPDRPPRARHARVPRRLRPAADRDDAQVRPQLPDDVGQRVRAHDRHGRRHRRDQRHPISPGHAGQGLDHRDDDPAPADAAGHDEAAPDHLADAVLRDRQHARDGRPLRPHPRRLPAAVRRPTPRTRARSTRSSSRSSGSS